MAGFLRKKTKQETVKPVPSAPIPLAAAVAPPPLFARFSTSTNSSAPASQRIVSSPMLLSSNARKEQLHKVGGRGNRDLDGAKRRTNASDQLSRPSPVSKALQDSPVQNQVPNKSLPPIQFTQIPLAPAFLVPIVDKPLPPPFSSLSSVDPSGSSPTPKQSRILPSAFQNQPPQGRSRTALHDVGEKEGQQSSRPPSVQSFYSVQTSNSDERRFSNHASLPLATNGAITSPPTRNSSHFSVSLAPQNHPPIANHKMQPNAAVSFGRQVLLPTTAQTQTPHILQRSVANQDLRAAKANGNMSMIGAENTQGSGVSGQGVGLPAEFHFVARDRSKSTPRPSLSTMGVATSHDLYPPYIYPKPRDHSNSPPLPPSNPPLRTEIPPRLPFQDLQQSAPQHSHKPMDLQPVPLKGKPLIFAAMAAQEDELAQMNGHHPYAQTTVKKRPSQSTYIQQQHHLPSAPDLGAYTNGSNAVKVDLKRFSGSLQPQLQPTAPSTPKPSNTVLEQLPPTPPSHSVPRTSRSNGSRSLQKQDEHPQSQHIPQTPSRTRKLSKARTHSDASSSVHAHHPNGSSITLPGTPDSHHRGGSGSLRTLTKSRPTTPVAPPHKPSFASPTPTAPLEPAIQLDEETISNAGIPLDDDPFARVEGVTLLKPSNSLKEKEKESGSNGKKHRNKQSSKSLPTSSVEDNSREEDAKAAAVSVETPPTPTSPEGRRTKKKRHDDDDIQTDPSPEPSLVEDGENDESDEPEPEPIPQYTMDQFLSDPQMLSSLLTFLSFYDWCVLSSLSKEIRILLVRTPELRETVLERFLKPVGYSRWIWDDPDPLSLSLQDLSDYMRGVSTPTHEYARIAGMYVHSLTVHPNHRDPSLLDTVRVLTASTQAYTRVILRLRAQAEKEAIMAQQSRVAMTMRPPNFNSPSPARGTNSRVSSRAPSPTTSSYSHSHSHSQNGHVHAPGSSGIQQSSSQTGLTFRSPLFRLRRAPLLRVFVPSPEGDWLSDKSVLACEAECKRAGVMHLMRLGDVVWDVAVGDEGNVGRLVWDGSYLIDLDYTYSPIGDLPKYMPTLAFPPSYFHRVIRTGPIVSNPIVHVDLSPWGEEIAMNLQLLQDRMRTETPQGAYHNVVRWVHRSSFIIRPRGPARYAQQGGKTQVLSPRIPIPDTDNLFVDSGWHGTIVVEVEGTNEALADLQERCGPGAFPPRSRGVNHHHQVSRAQIENRKVFRILREKSRPGEIWIKAVGIKERLL